MQKQFVYSATGSAALHAITSTIPCRMYTYDLANGSAIGVVMPLKELYEARMIIGALPGLTMLPGNHDTRPLSAAILALLPSLPLPTNATARDLYEYVAKAAMIAAFHPDT